MKILSLRKHFVTLMEMMIVMVIIASVIGVVAWNYTGSLDKTNEWKTEQTMNKIRNVLILHLAEHPEDIDRIEQDWKSIVLDSPHTRGDAKDLLRDGWGKPFTVRVNEDSMDGDAEIIISSDAYNRRKKKH